MTRGLIRALRGDDLIARARELASEAHKDQVRKYTNEPYFTHLQEVATLVAQHGGTSEMIAAAFLHDLIEDQGDKYTYQSIEVLGNDTVVHYVKMLTDVPSTESRKVRKEAALQRLAAAPAEVQTIKYADLISNRSSIVKHDPKFAVTYLREALDLLDALYKGHLLLRALAYRKVLGGYAELVSLMQFPDATPKSVSPADEKQHAARRYELAQKIYTATLASQPDAIYTAAADAAYRAADALLNHKPENQR